MTPNTPFYPEPYPGWYDEQDAIEEALYEDARKRRTDDEEGEE